MKYQKNMQKIMEQLTAYKAKIDEIAVAYVAEKEKHEKELEEMKGKFTPEYIKENREKWTPRINYGEIIGLARETYEKIAMDYFNKVKLELDEYFQIPVDSGFAATVTAVKNLGVTLGNKEFELLQNAAGGFWGLKLLSELGNSRTKIEQGAELENGQAKRVEKEIKTPYTAVVLPDVENIYNALQSVKNALDIAFSSYCGEGYVLKDIVFASNKTAEETNAKLAETYGVQTQKEMLDTVTISKMANASKFFDENNASYVRFIEMMDGLAATIPKAKKKEVLTDDDKKLIDMIINPDYSTLAQVEAVKIAKADEHLAEILRLDTRYGTAVKAALGEVSENE